MATKTFDPLLAICFSVDVDGHPLGHWTEAKLGGISLEMDDHEEGGNGLFVHHLPGQMKYDNITLSRYMTEESMLVGTWFQSMNMVPAPTTARITALGRDWETVATFSYIGVLPVKWTLPSFNLTSNTAATETLELAHTGFVTTL